MLGLVFPILLSLRSPSSAPPFPVLSVSNIHHPQWYHARRALCEDTRRALPEDASTPPCSPRSSQGRQPTAPLGCQDAIPQCHQEDGDRSRHRDYISSCRQDEGILFSWLMLD
ncbi:hypothetical protein GUJ93_ZPchr0005g15191 [Zizania palustris]|uniref:Secreted protein n=1 Tax=Zizania palustris TaxID=103762 RepID=A0A8J5W1X5_ZIZPA|nr:hypothetical protein GUJ93_ZPchr0005g15191 [Zizania palustris]